MMEDNNFLTLSQASRLTGKSKSVISNALRSGALRHVSRNSAGYKIDPQEIIRVYGHPEPKKSDTPSKNDHENEILKLKNQHLEEKLKMVERENEYLRKDKEDLRKDKEDWKNLAFRQLDRL